MNAPTVIGSRSIMPNDSTEQGGRTLPIPDDFPVTWDSEEEASSLWRWDDIHSPLPASPMSVLVSSVLRIK